MKNGVLAEYCTGCGLCQSVYGTELKEDENGFLVPELHEGEAEKLAEICPAGGAATLEMKRNAIWGTYEQVCRGWASEEKLRYAASSGGVLTALCCFLLESKRVDGIIQTKSDAVYRTKIVISRTTDEVKSCIGSRYAVSSPLRQIKQMVCPGERYAFVGKPCDVSALRMYLKKDASLAGQIPYLFSFFCAGTPGLSAQKKLLKALDCKDESECAELQYRGNGWPGFATAKKTDGGTARISYTDSWGGILGRDVRKICRYCVDGIGEMADVSCGDAWYLNQELQPDFSEHEGRNVIFARTSAGTEVLKEALEAGVLVLEAYPACESELKYIQRYQLERRATMRAMLLGLRLCGKNAPNYSAGLLKDFSREVSRKLRIKRFLGTVKRVLQKKI